MARLEEGQVFERYFVIRWLGSGVSGESYEARDVVLQRMVTLKLIHPWFALPDSARRQFFREMQGISRLNHPYLASVLDYGENNDILYVVRRYTTSGSLLGSEGRIWYHPPLDVLDAIHYAHQLAQALEYIHSRGYLHGALSFANILILRGPTIEDDPKQAPFLLADVGLANFVHRFGQPRISLLPITAAPEQIGKRETAASDQFALAVLLFSWLAGRPPYLGSPEEIEQLKLTETIASLHSLNPNVSSEQEGIMRRALAAYPDKRYPSILSFAEALLATITPLPETVSTPAPLPEAGLSFNLQPEPITIQPEFRSTPTPTTPATPTTPTSTATPTPTPTLDMLLTLMSQARQEAESPACFIITSPYTEEPGEVNLEREEITLGRAGSSDILLDHDPQTSRHHALLKRENNRYVIYDRRSISGVFVNGQKLAGDTGQVLSDGDHIRIGNYGLIFRSGTRSPVH
jgi:serine/threonine protein kinase